MVDTPRDEIGGRINSKHGKALKQSVAPRTARSSFAMYVLQNFIEGRLQSRVDEMYRQISVHDQKIIQGLSKLFQHRGKIDPGNTIAFRVQKVRVVNEHSE